MINFQLQTNLWLYKVSRVSLWFGQCHSKTEGYLKIRLQSLYTYIENTSTAPLYLYWKYEINFETTEKKSYNTLICTICRELIESDENIKISIKDKI